MKVCKHGHNYEASRKKCPICYKEWKKKYYKQNSDVIKERIKKWYKQNFDAVKEQKKKYYKQNSVTIIKKRIEYEKTRRATDQIFKFKIDVRSLIRKSFKRCGYKKNSRAENVLGCDFETARNHLIQTAIKNYGKYDATISYHIDHVIPLKTATTEEKVIELCHISNLQYLTEADNLSKNAKLDWTIFKNEVDR